MSCWGLGADPLSAAFFSLGTKLCWNWLNLWVRTVMSGSQEHQKAESTQGRQHQGALESWICLFPTCSITPGTSEWISLWSAHTLSICNCLLLQSCSSSYFNPTTHTWSSPTHPVLPRKGSCWHYCAPFLCNPSQIPLGHFRALLAGRVTAPHLLLAGGHWSNLHKIPQTPAWNLCHSLSAGS